MGQQGENNKRISEDNLIQGWVCFIGGSMKHLLRVIATVLMYWGTRSLALKFDSFAIAYLGGIIALGLNMIIESC